MQSTTDKKKVKYMFKTKKGSINCSKLIINEIARSPARSENVYFANNEQVFTAVFCFTHAEHHLIKLKYIIIVSASCKRCAM